MNIDNLLYLPMVPIVIGMFFPTTATAIALLLGVGCVGAFFLSKYPWLLNWFDRPWMIKYLGNKYLTIVLVGSSVCLWAWAYMEMPTDGQVAVHSALAGDDEWKESVLTPAMDPNYTPQPPGRHLAPAEDSMFSKVAAKCKAQCTEVNANYEAFKIRTGKSLECECLLSNGKTVNLVVPRGR